MRPFLLALPFLTLAACEPEPENIQAKADSVSRRLEQRADELKAEAENEVEAQAAPLENEAAALLNRIGGDAAEGNMASANTQ